MRDLSCLEALLYLSRKGAQLRAGINVSCWYIVFLLNHHHQSMLVQNSGVPMPSLWSLPIFLNNLNQIRDKLIRIVFLQNGGKIGISVDHSAMTHKAAYLVMTQYKGK
jgi:hypothetical protein